jgi:hypothetical protein
METLETETQSARDFFVGFDERHVARPLAALGSSVPGFGARKTRALERDVRRGVPPSPPYEQNSSALRAVRELRSPV